MIAISVYTATCSFLALSLRDFIWFVLQLATNLPFSKKPSSGVRQLGKKLPSNEGPLKDAQDLITPCRLCQNRNWRRRLRIPTYTQPERGGHHSPGISTVWNVKFVLTNTKAAGIMPHGGPETLID